MKSYCIHKVINSQDIKVKGNEPRIIIPTAAKELGLYDKLYKLFEICPNKGEFKDRLWMEIW